MCRGWQSKIRFMGFCYRMELESLVSRSLKHTVKTQSIKELPNKWILRQINHLNLQIAEINSKVYTSEHKSFQFMVLTKY